MGNALILHTDKIYSEQEQENLITKAYKAYEKTHKKPHGGFEIDIKFLTGKNLEYKKSFALMLIVKKHFTNSMVYNYSTESLSEKTGISKYIIETYIKRLISFEFCHFQGNHLQFVSLNKIMPLRSRGEVIYISEKSTINEIVETLNILILKNNFSNQDTLRKIKNDLSNSRKQDAKINLKSYKKSLKIAEANPKIKDEKLIDFNVIGMRKLSQIIGSSLDYAARFIKNLLRKKLITIDRIVKKYANFEFNQFSSDELKDFINKKSGYFFSFNGCTYHYLGTQIEFI